MNLKDVIALLFVGLAFLLFTLVGFNIVESDGEFDIVVLAFASFTLGYIIHEFVPASTP